MKRIIYIFLFLLPVVSVAQQTWYKSSPLDYMWMNVGNAGFSGRMVRDIGLACHPISGQPYVAFCDTVNSYKATVMKYDGTNWTDVGNPGFSAGECSYISLAFNPSGEPYVAYADNENPPRATVMKFDGTNWVYVGIVGFSAGQVWFTNIAFSPTGEPYVAYSDLANNGRTTVMKFDGTNWVVVGIAGFSATGIDCLSFAFSPSGQPYVAYPDIGTLPMHEATVMKFDGTNWVYVGSHGFSPGFSAWTSIAFSPVDNLPYVAFQDDLNDSYKATVMKFDGSVWVNVGSAGFSAGMASYTSLAFSPSGQPCVAYQDYGISKKATVMKFDGTNWVTLGSPGFSSGEAISTSLVFSPSGKPYVAYIDNGDSLKTTVMTYDSVFAGVNQPREFKLSLYPDPASANLTIDLKYAMGNVRIICIYDLRENKIFEASTDKDRISLNVQNWPAGIYFVKIKTENSYWIGKFCKD